MLGKCLVDDCGRIPYSRGLCIRCWRNAKKSVKKGLYTWKYLEEIEMSIKLIHEPRSTITMLEILKRDKYHALLYEKRNEGKDYKDYIRI